MIKFKLSIISFLLMTASCSSQEQYCNQTNIKKSSVKALLEQLKTGSWSADIEGRFQFPIDVLIDGRVEVFRSAFELELSWEDIVDQNSSYLDSTDVCKVASNLKLRLTNDDLKITSLSFPIEVNDTKLTSYSIRSVKSYVAFINDLNRNIESKKYSMVAKQVTYPFMLEHKGISIKVKNEEEFVRYGSSIVNSKFTILLKDAANFENLNKHPNGIMLNSRGDIWVVGLKNGELKLDIVDLH